MRASGIERPAGGRVLAALLGFLALLLAAPSARAQAGAETEEGCPGLIARRAPLVQPAALGAQEVALPFVGHATFLIESPGGVRVATDYNDYVRPPLPLDLVTMNKAHSTHYSDHPDPGIPHVLRGWNPAGGPARYDVTVGDVRVRNVATNIRRGYGYDLMDRGPGGTEYDGNSIFIFEVAGLCIAHLGHLHHPLEASHLAKIGRVDVVLVPVDGGYTLDLAGMIDVLDSLKAKLMLPMHYFGPSTLERFLTLARERYVVSRRDSPTLVLSRATLPASPEVVVLPGR